MPELHLDGLSAADSRTLLDSVLIGRLDGTVRERLLAETHGNPLALIELPRALTAAEAATGIVRQSRDSLSTRIEDSFRRQLEPLPDDDAAVAASRGGGAARRSAPARPRCSAARPRHRVCRCCRGGRAVPDPRAVLVPPSPRSLGRVRGGDAGRATAGARRARRGDRPAARPGSEGVASGAGNAGSRRGGGDELERTAARAKARGGLAAAGAFLERAAMLTPDAGKRAERALAAAEVMYEAGAFDSAENLLRAIDTAATRRAPTGARRTPRSRSLLVAAASDDGEEAVLRLARRGRAPPRARPGARVHAHSMRCGRFWSADPRDPQSAVARAREVPASEPARRELLCGDGRSCWSRDIRREQICFARR